MIFFGSPFATQIAEDIRARIHTETGLTASAGVSYNKFLAKLASDYRKPDGLFVLTPKMGPAFVGALQVGKFHGVGPATTTKMNRLGIETGARRQSADACFPSAPFREIGDVCSRPVFELIALIKRICSSIWLEASATSATVITLLF